MTERGERGQGHQEFNDRNCNNSAFVGIIPQKPAKAIKSKEKDIEK